MEIVPLKAGRESAPTRYGPLYFKGTDGNRPFSVGHVEMYGRLLGRGYIKTRRFIADPVRYPDKGIVITRAAVHLHTGPEATFDKVGTVKKGDILEAVSAKGWPGQCRNRRIPLSKDL